MHAGAMTPEAPGTFYLDLPDRRIRAQWVGHPAPAPSDPFAPVMVFLHEGLGCVDLWRGFPAAVCARTGLRGLVYDRTGYGRSSAWPSPPGARYLRIESDLVLPQVLDAAGVEACLLIGHGDGGTIALHVAAAQPPLLRGVVAIGAHVVSEARTVASHRHALEAFEHSDFRARLLPYHGANVDAAFRTWNDAWLTPGFVPIDAGARLPRVRVPVLFLQGEHDEYGTVAQLHAVARGVSGRCEARRLPGCGHAPHVQDESTTVEAIARFVATLWRAPAGEARGIGRVLPCLLLCLGLAVAAPSAQPDPCASADVQAVFDVAAAQSGRGDDGAAAAGLARARDRFRECREIGVAALALDGWVEARRLATVGGAPSELDRMHAIWDRLATVRATRPPTSLIAQLAAYADAVLRAAVAAAQDERDEMQVYLVHAGTVAESLGQVRTSRFWPLPLALAEGELWLEVDRFAEARAAFLRVGDARFEDRAAGGLAPALERLGDTSGACAAYRRAAAGSLPPTNTERARLAVIRLKCPPG